MSKIHLLQIINGRILDPTLDQEYEADILIEGQKIARIDRRWLKPSITIPGTKVIDAHGAYLAPALWDLHVHLREPGQEHKETMATAAQAAARGGVGRMFAMPNTEPAIDNKKTLALVQEKAKAQETLVDIEFVAAVTKARKGRSLTAIKELAALGAAAFSDDGSPVANEKIFRKALKETRQAGTLLMEHAEDPKLSKNGVMNEGEISRRLGVPGIPRESEIQAVQKKLKLLKESHARLHLCHISTQEAVSLIRQAKSKGAERLTCEACPHHFSLTENSALTLGPLAKVNPPLRAQRDVEAIQEGLADGTIDAIASDHAPHAKAEKALGLKEAPFGMIGLETMLPATITFLVKTGRVPLMRAIRLLTTGPAHVLRRPPPKIEPGEPANLIVFDPKTSVTFRSFASKSTNSPFLGKKLYGRVLLTLHQGQIVHKA